MISTDRKMFEQGSAVSQRMIQYAKKYDELHIIVFRLSDAMVEAPTEVALSENCWVYSTQSKLKIFYPFDAIRLGKFIISRRQITNITCQDPFLTAMAGLSLKNQSHLPLEINIHTDIGSPYFVRTIGNKIRKAMALSYIPKADHIRVVSERIQKYLTEKLKIENSKIEVRPIPVDIERIKNLAVKIDLHQKYPQFRKIILMASRLEKEKNISLAIEAFFEIRKTLGDVGLIIVGEGSQKTLIQKQILKAGLKDSVILEPWADNETLISYYKTTDLFLSVSLYEGYGITFVESKAAGCPIVSTDVGVAREAGATIVGYNVKEIAEAIILKLK